MDETDETQRYEEDGTSQIVRSTFDWSAVPPSVAVTEAVGRASGRDPAAVGPLIASFDPDALDALVQSSERGGAGSETTVEFVVDDYHVSVRSDGVVVVSDCDADHPPVDE